MFKIFLLNLLLIDVPFSSSLLLNEESFDGWPANIQTHTAKTLYRKFETKTVFPEMKLRGLVPNSYIHVYVSD